MGKSLEEVLAELTGKQIRAIALKVWSALGGRDNFGENNVRRLLACELRIMVEETVEELARQQVEETVDEIFPQQPATKPPLIGTMVKTLQLNPYKVKSIVQAIKLGKYNSHDADIITLFADDEVSLAKAVSVDLFQFDRDWFYEEVIAWANGNGKKPILPKHLYAIGIQHREEQRKAPIVAFGSVRHGYVLDLYGGSDWRDLSRYTVRGGWGRDYLVGFLSE